MGSKQWLARRVARLCDDKPVQRPLVDLFGGMCSVAGAVANSGRPAWVNDVQSYAVSVARCLVSSPKNPPRRETAEARLAAPYRRNLKALVERFQHEIRRERQILDRTRSEYCVAAASWQHVGNNEALAAEASGLRSDPQRFPYRMTSLTFAWGYFGLRQSVEIDSIRYAIDHARRTEAIGVEDAAWMRVALLQTASRIASAPGHFAQYLNARTDAGHRRIIACRRRSAWDSFLEDLGRVRPFGTTRWRRRNRVFHSDALELWDEFDRVKPSAPAVFYADPPYSKEHYSRYYHVLESLDRYDYPEASGTGRYRQDRFRTSFSIKSEVAGAVESLASAISARDGTLLLSYPSSGLLTCALEVDVAEMLRAYFSDVRLVIQAEAAHSTLGGRHGSSHQEVLEYVWLAD